MKNVNLSKYITAGILALLLAFPFTMALQEGWASTEEEDSEALFSQEELDQMLAPIALYPDALLAQILTAATYPLEVVSAARFVKEKEGLKGGELLEVALDKDWDPSVKAMLEFPGVLAMMDEQLDWTVDLGDAFLAQPSDVMDSIQHLREKAYAQGNLVTNEEQVVKVESQPQIIIIEAASPQIVYVPVYDPLVAYGLWWYPDYSPYYYYPVGYLGARFTRVVMWGGWGIWGCDWHHHYVRVHVKRHNNFTRHHYKRYGHYQIRNDGRKDHAWRHDPQHRRNAGYRDSSTARRFGGQKRPGVTKKSSKSDLRRQEGRNTKQLKSNASVKAKGKAKTRPLAIISAGKRTGVSTKQKTSAIKKTSGIKPKANDARKGIKDKKSVRSSKKDLNTSARKQKKEVKQSKSNARVKAKGKAKTRPLVISTGNRKSANVKKRTRVIKRTSGIEPRVGDAKRNIKNWTSAKPRTRNSKISVGTQAGRRSKRGNSKFRAGRRK